MSLSLLLVISADASVPVFMGWSDDGSTVAFFQYGVHDGSGFPFAYLEIRGPRLTERHFYEFFCYEEETNNEWFILRARKAARASGVSGDKMGQRLEVRLVDTMRMCCDTCPAVLRKYSCGDGMFYIEETRCAEPGDNPWPQGAVKGLWRGKEVFSLPIEGNGFSWWLHEAYSYEGRLALVLGYLMPGFEGPDTRFRLFSLELK